MSVKVTGEIGYRRGRVHIESEHGSGELAAAMYLQAVACFERDMFKTFAADDSKGLAQEQKA